MANPTPALPGVKHRFPFTQPRVDAIPTPAPGKRVEYSDMTTKGLMLRVSPSSRVYYLFRHASGSGRMERLRIGSTADLNLAEARREAEKINGQIARGISPATEKKAIRDAITLDELFQKWREAHGQHLRSVRDADTIWKLHIPSAWKNRRALSIGGNEVAGQLKKIAKETPRTANKTRALIRTLYRKGRAWGLGVTVIPTEAAAPEAEQSRNVVIPRERREAFIVALDAKETPPDLRRFVYLALLTGMRSKNLRTLTMEQITFDGRRNGWATARIDSQQSKNKRAMDIALVPDAADLVRRLPAGPVFSYRSEAGLRKEWGEFRERAGFPGLRIHDLRRTFATMSLEAGASLPVLSKQLAHLSKTQALAYAIAGESEARDATKAVSDALAKIRLGI